LRLSCDVPVAETPLQMQRTGNPFFLLFYFKDLYLLVIERERGKGRAQREREKQTSAEQEPNARLNPRTLRS